MHTQMDSYQATKIAAQSETKITDLPMEILTKISKHVGNTMEELQPLAMTNTKFMQAILGDYKFVVDIVRNEHHLGYRHMNNMRAHNRAYDDQFNENMIAWDYAMFNHMTDFVNRIAPGWEFMDQIPDPNPYRGRIMQVCNRVHMCMRDCLCICIPRTDFSYVITHLCVCTYTYRRWPTTSSNTPSPPGDPGPRHPSP